MPEFLPTDPDWWKERYPQGPIDQMPRPREDQGAGAAGANPWGAYMRPWAGTFQGPAVGGGGGGGGGGMVAKVGPFTPERFGFREFQPSYPTNFAYSGFEAPERFRAPVTPWTPQPFVPPTGAAIYEDPGYQFRLEEGAKALERSAAARGVLRTGGTLKDLLSYGQDLASQEYENVYGRRWGEHQYGQGMGLTANELAYGRAEREQDRLYGQMLDEYQMAYGQRADEFGRGVTLGELARGAYGTQFGAATGIYDRGYQADLAKYQFAAEQAAQEAAMAEAAAGRGASAQAAAYRNAWNEYMTGYDIFSRERDYYTGQKRWETGVGLETE